MAMEIQNQKLYSFTGVAGQYTETEVQQLHDEGKISDKDWNEFQNSLKTDSSDEADVNYELTDEAMDVNEAELLVKGMETGGANLKTVIDTLIGNCKTKNDEMKTLNEKVEAQQQSLDALCGTATEVSAEGASKVKDANEIVEDAQKKVEDLKAEIQKKEAEAEKAKNDLQKAVDNGDEEGAKEPQAKLDALNVELESLQSELKSATNYAKDASVKAKNAKSEADKKYSLTEAQVENLSSMLKDSAVEAQNANEFAETTISKGEEARNISDKGKATEAGYTKGRFGSFAFGVGIGKLMPGLGISSFMGKILSLLGSKLGDVDKAHSHGNQAIAVGNQLGNATVKVATAASQMANDAGISIANSSLENITAKEYVDTSALDKVNTDFADAKGIKKAIGNMISNKKMNEIADAYENKKNAKGTEVSSSDSVSSKNNAEKDIEFAKSLPNNSSATETTLQVGHGSPKIKGYYAKNPETGNTVYADETGRHYTEAAFKNWEQFAKDGTFVS